MARDWTFTVVETINSNTDALTYDTSGSFLPVVGRLYVIYVMNSKATTPDEASGVAHDPAGTPRAFTAKGTALQMDTAASPLKRGRWWMWLCANATSAPVRVTFPATQTGCRAIVWEVNDTTDTEPYANEKKGTADANVTISATPDALASTDNLLLAVGLHDLNTQNDVPSGTNWNVAGAGLANSNPNMTLEGATNEGGVAQQLTFTTAGSADRGIHIVEIAAPIATGQPTGRRHGLSLPRNRVHGIEGVRYF